MIRCEDGIVDDFDKKDLSTMVEQGGREESRQVADKDDGKSKRNGTCSPSTLGCKWNTFPRALSPLTCTAQGRVMLRNVTRLNTVDYAIPHILPRHLARSFAAGRPGADVDEAEIDAGRKWLAKLDADTIRQNAVCDISFSRSSGPGGQNVNKSVVHFHILHIDQV